MALHLNWTSDLQLLQATFLLFMNTDKEELLYMRSKAAKKTVKPKPLAKLCSLPLILVDPPPKNTRTDITEPEFLSLVESNRIYGVLEPVLVREVTTRKGYCYQIIAGARRLLASKKAGLSEIPAQVMDLNDDEALGAQVVENLQCQYIHPLDEADGFSQLKDNYNLEIAQVARRLGSPTAPMPDGLRSLI